MEGKNAAYEEAFLKLFNFASVAFYRDDLEQVEPPETGLQGAGSTDQPPVEDKRPSEIGRRRRGELPRISW
jgi:hypothetical protein